MDSNPHTFEEAQHGLVEGVCSIFPQPVQDYGLYHTHSVFVHRLGEYSTNAFDEAVLSLFVGPC